MSKLKEELRLGAEKIAIFENEGEHGAYYNAQIEGRGYKDGEKWKTSHSYNAQQLASNEATSGFSFYFKHRLKQQNSTFHCCALSPG